MSTPSDLMTQMLLAQITDLQRRVTQQDGVISALKTEVERIGGRTTRTGIIPISSHTQSHTTSHNSRQDTRNHQGVHTHNIVNTTVPLTASVSANTTQSSVDVRRRHDGHNHRHQAPPYTPGARRNKVETESDAGERSPPVSLSALLKDGEEVTVRIGVGKDESGGFTHTTCVASYTGGELVVSSCEKVPSLVGEKSDKPGALVARFMKELYDAKVIPRLFKFTPWKLCSVVRDGKSVSLDELKNIV